MTGSWLSPPPRRRRRRRRRRRLDLCRPPCVTVTVFYVAGDMLVLGDGNSAREFLVPELLDACTVGTHRWMRVWWGSLWHM